uniref:Inhibitor I9 domain-containing protein n=1 Tax=Salix viminalis TaxID=40686 RepID=A0A6N2JW53_SALVM
MASLLHHLFSLSLLIIISSTASNQLPQHYVVYMGSSSSGEAPGIAESDHLQLFHESERISLIHHYSHAFKGFSAMLTENEASALAGHDGIVSIFQDPILQLHTTRSWDFLEAASGMQYKHKHPPMSSDVIIGMIDTGIWPESPSFNDDGIGEIPSRWKGVCMEGYDFKKSNCNS